MQNVLKLSNRNMFRYKINYLNHLPKNLINSNQNIRQCLNHNQIYRLFGLVPQNTLRQSQREYKAIHSMLVRSYFFQISSIYELDHRYFSNQCIRLNKNNLNHSSNSSFNQNKNKKNNDEKKEKNLLKYKLYLIFAIVYTCTITISNMFSINFFVDQTEDRITVSWYEFVHQILSKGEVKEIIIIPEIDIVKIRVHNNAIIKGQKSKFSFYIMPISDAMKIEERIREAERALGIKTEFGVPIMYRRTYIPDILIYIIGLLILLFLVLKSRFPQIREMYSEFYNHMNRAKFTLVDPLTGKGKGIKFSDVAGLREAKIEIMEFVDYLRRPDYYKALGAKLPKGTLLLGPPGCGKTLLAKAVATEANVPFLSMNGSEFNEVVGGLGAARIRSLFHEAKKRAPSIIYIDEIDTIGRNRLDFHLDKSTDESEQTLNQLLTEMDGMKTRQDVMVLASTNRSKVLDKALLRPGRFDRHIYISYPDIRERKEIFELHLKKLNLDHKPRDYSEKLANMSAGSTGADIANLCNEAALHAARLMKKHVQFSDLMWATERKIGGCEKIDSTVAETEKRIIAYYEAGRALVGWMLASIDDLYKISIVQRTNNTFGMHAFREKIERKIWTKEEVEEMICYGLAGRASESLIFNLMTTNAQNDLKEVKRLAYTIVQEMGMSKSVGLIAFSKEELSDSRKLYSKMLGHLMDQEVRLIVAKMFKRAQEILFKNKEKLNQLAEQLLEKESLTYEEIKEILGPREFKQKKHLIVLNN